jgi:hypothetical protein
VVVNFFFDEISQQGGRKDTLWQRKHPEGEGGRGVALDSRGALQYKVYAFPHLRKEAVAHHVTQLEDGAEIGEHTHTAHTHRIHDARCTHTLHTRCTMHTQLIHNSCTHTLPTLPAPPTLLPLGTVLTGPDVSSRWFPLNHLPQERRTQFEQEDHGARVIQDAIRTRWVKRKGNGFAEVTNLPL